VQVLVEEGEPTSIGRVDVHGLDALPSDLAERAQREVARAVRVGARFEESRLDAGSQALSRVLANNGYAYVSVRPAADVDVTRNVAAVGYWVDSGRRVRIGRIDIQGLGKIPREQIVRTLGLREGGLYSRDDLDEAQRRVLDLGVFSSVRVEAQPPKAQGTDSDTVPIDVRLEPARLGSVRLGAGLQLDSQHTDVHLVTGWEDKNFLGGLRSLQVSFFPGAVIWPTRLPELESPQRLLPEARLTVDLRQPGILDAATYGLVNFEGSITPVLLSSQRQAGDPILGYRNLRAAVGLERSLYRKLHATLTQNLQISDPFAYVGSLDPDANTAIVSYPELLITLDLRDDPIEPRAGAFFSNSFQVAGVGGKARDLKVQPDLRGYVPLGRGLTLASRASVGFLFPQNYGDTIALDAATGSGGPNRAAWVRDVELMYLRGFFGGGPGSNRGYALREIGPHGAIPFYNPSLDTQQTGACAVTQVTASGELPPDCRLPLGGFSLWEASLELRFPITGPLRGAVFADTGDVSPYKVDIRLDHPHLSAGVGVRYGTPIGPVRLDVGYRVPGVQAPRGSDDYSPAEIFGFPIAISIGIGEPF
jgi:outer membrane protein insertion porin family/translocation and assembly module TamA